MKTIHELNEKLWYRLVKVLFGLSFLLVGTLVFVITYDNYSPRQIQDYLVTCNFGNKQSFLAGKEKQIYIYSYSDNIVEDLSVVKHALIRQSCEITQEEITKNLDDIFKGNGRKTLFTIDKVSITEGTKVKATLCGLFGIIITGLLFEIIRRLLV
jgi:hypothetical protein